MDPDLAFILILFGSITVLGLFVLAFGGRARQ